MNFNTGVGNIIIDYPLKYNTEYKLTANDFNMNTSIIFNITKKLDNKTYEISDLGDNINIPANSPYRFTKNVNLSVLPSQ